MLSVEDQLRLAVAPYAIEEGDAERVTVGLDAEFPKVWFGASVSNVVDPTPPPHDASAETANNTATMALDMTFILTGLMCDMIQFLTLKFGCAIQCELHSSQLGCLISFTNEVRLAG